MCLLTQGNIGKIESDEVTPSLGLGAHRPGDKKSVTPHHAPWSQGAGGGGPGLSEHRVPHLLQPEELGYLFHRLAFLRILYLENVSSQ